MTKILKNILSILLSSFSSGAKSMKRPPPVIAKKLRKNEKSAGINLSTQQKKKMTKELLKEIYLVRGNYHEKGTTGQLNDETGAKICLTLEEPWKDNQKGISCIPEGRYRCTRYISPKLRRKGVKDPEVILLHDVPNRSYVQIHVGNTLEDVEGCIMTGENMARKVTYKGKLHEFFIKSSGKMFKILKEKAAPEFDLIVRS